MTKELILARLAELNTAVETRSFTDEEFTEVTDLESQLAQINKTEEFRARHAAYVAPSLAAAVHIAPPKEDDTLERAFTSYLKTGIANQDLQELRAQTVGTDSAGGYTVPDNLLARIETRMKAFAGVETVADVEVSDDGRKQLLPANDDTANYAVPVGENALPASGGADLTVSQVELETHTYTTSGAGQNPLAVSWQLLQDSVIDIESWLTERISERFGRGFARGFVNGTGTGEPFGVTTNATTTSTFTSATIDKDELIAALHTVDPAYRSADAVWIFSDATLAAIRKLEDSQGRPLWTPQAAAGLEGSIGGTLLGHRVVIDQGFAPYADATTNKFGVFGSIKTGYWIRKVRGLRLIVDETSAAGSAMIRYTAHARVGANVKQPNAYTVLKNAV